MNGAEDFLLKCASETGVDLAGICDLSVFSSHAETVRRGVGDEPLAFYRKGIEGRFDLRGEWDRAEGIISFGMSYLQSEENPPDDGYVRICRASWGRDYHDVLKEHAERMMELFIKQYPLDYRIYVDSGELSDRSCAYSAGLGFYSKNGFIVSPVYGSFIFLGHILTDKALFSSHEPMECGCAGCDRCISACPTGALGEKPYVDYERCISFLNQKGRSYFVTDYVYGCDICQEVCPYNLRAPKDLHPEFAPDKDLIKIRPQDLIDMDTESFDRHYGSAALSWRGPGTLKKNAKRILKRNMDVFVPPDDIIDPEQDGRRPKDRKKKGGNDHV